MNFRNLILVFLFISPISYGAGKDSGKLLPAQSTSNSASSSKRTQATVPKDILVRGIIIKFHNWPSEKEEASIQNQLKKFDLKSVEELKQLSMWIFSWSKTDQIIKAEMACHSLSDFSSIKLCGPDHSVTTESPETGDLKSCDIVSASFGLQSGKLSDYWAQRMIGSDLIKEELDRAGPIGKKELVRVFDKNTRDHNQKVKNLISDDGDHSVLPDIGNKMKESITPYTSNILREANRLLQNAENVCASDSEEGDDTDQPPQQPPPQRQPPPQQQRQQQSSQQQQQGSEPETFTHDGKEYIRLHGWAHNRNYKVSSVISFLGRNNVQIEQVDNPYIDQLKAAGESWSPTIHAVLNTTANQEKLEEWVQARGTITYSRNLKLFWNTATDWSTAWKSASGDQTPSTDYDLEADYEVNKSKSGLHRMEYSYIFRRPTLDMRGASSISTDMFNWLPFIVLVESSRKLKIWGTREVGNGPLTINGVSVTLTEVPGTISDVPSSGKRHGQFEATLNAADYNTILTGGGTTSNQRSSQQQPPQQQQRQPQSQQQPQQQQPQQQPPQQQQQPPQQQQQPPQQQQRQPQSQQQPPQQQQQPPQQQQRQPQSQQQPPQQQQQPPQQQQRQPQSQQQPPQQQQQQQTQSQSSSSSSQRSSQRRPSSDSTSDTKSGQPLSGSVQHLVPQKSNPPGGVSQGQETVAYNGITYIILRVWANNRGLNLADVINFLRKEGVSILQVNNPQAAALRAAGKSWSPTVHAILDSESNRSKLAYFSQGQR